VIRITRSGSQRTEIRPMHTDRIRTSLPVEIRVAGRVAEGTVRNASDGGVFVETRAIPPQGESVTLRFYPRSEARVEVSGIVWWTTEGSAFRHRWRGFGFRLLEDDARYAELLAGLRPEASAARRITASQRKTLAAASEAIRDSGKSQRSR
jgi:hypothetical protein